MHIESLFEEPFEVYLNVMQFIIQGSHLNVLRIRFESKYYESHCGHAWPPICATHLVSHTPSSVWDNVLLE